VPADVIRQPTNEDSPPCAERRLSRATAMPADERRLAIIEATLPLLLQHGAAVTTRQIAESAGIAEGTIFRVFADKETLLDAAMEAALDPAPAQTALAAIDRGLPFEDRLIAAVDIIQRRLTGMWRLASAVGFERVKNSKNRHPPIVQGLAELFEPDAGALDRRPGAAATVLHALTLALSHPMIVTDQPTPPAEIVALFLDGVRRRPAAPVRSGGTPC
jgi:AcrR family transcriptional regulator